MDIFIQQVVSGLATGGIYASLALALVMIYQATDVVNFAQGEMAMFATYICWSLINAGLPYWLAFLSTLAIAFVGGVVIERVVIRPVENAPILSIVIVFIGLLVILNSLADRAYLLETGRVMISGSAETIRNDEAVRRSYLGY